MQNLQELSKQTVLDGLPTHFIEQNTTDIIRRLEELKGDNWRYYLVEPCSFGGDHSEVLHVLTGVDKQSTIDEIIKRVVFDVEYPDDREERDADASIYTKILMDCGLLKSKTESATNIQQFLIDNITLDDGKDYHFMRDAGYHQIISCHSNFIFDMLNQLTEYGSL